VLCPSGVRLIGAAWMLALVEHASAS